MKQWVAVVVLMAACGGDGGGGDDAPADSAPSGPAFARGTAERTVSPQFGPPTAVTAIAVREADGVEVARVGPGAATFELTIPTDGGRFDGFVRIETPEFLPTELYPQRAPLAGTTLEENPWLYTQQDKVNFAGAAAGGSPNNAWIVVRAPQHAVVSAVPAGLVRYVQMFSDTPRTGLTEVQANGLAYIMSVPTGRVTVTATLTGAAPLEVVVTTRAGAITETVLR